MKVSKEQAISHLDSVIEKYGQASLGTSYDDLAYNPTATRVHVLTSMVAALERLAPEGTYYFRSLETTLSQHKTSHVSAIPELLGIIKALRDAYASGYLQEIQELIHADVFSDFLEMADYLLREGYKDPAAVIAGGVLEGHLRKLCEKHSIDTTTGDRPRRAEAMNEDLGRKPVYNKLEQKNVTAWLELRNKAAHGKYGEYTTDHVELMHRGIRDFVARLPA